MLPRPGDADEERLSIVRHRREPPELPLAAERPWNAAVPDQRNVQFLRASPDVLMAVVDGKREEVGQDLSHRHGRLPDAGDHQGQESSAAFQSHPGGGGDVGIARSTPVDRVLPEDDHRSIAFKGSGLPPEWKENPRALLEDFPLPVNDPPVSPEEEEAEDSGEPQETPGRRIARCGVEAEDQGGPHQDQAAQREPPADHQPLRVPGIEPDGRVVSAAGTESDADFSAHGESACLGAGSDGNSLESEPDSTMIGRAGRGGCGDAGERWEGAPKGGEDLSA